MSRTTEVALEVLRKIEEEFEDLEDAIECHDKVIAMTMTAYLEAIEENERTITAGHPDGTRLIAQFTLVPGNAIQ